MSLHWFELPPPAELGDGWSLGFLTAAQMLESRGEGEAKAGEERDKALWANAALLARVLLKEGEPAFVDGEAVLKHLTVGQIDSLIRCWWAQDDFSGQSVQKEWPTQEEGTDREQGENERFDMARYLELGGTEGGISQKPMAEGFTAAGSSIAAQIWPQRGSTPRITEEIQKMYRKPYMAEGVAMPYDGGTVPLEVPAFQPGRTPEGEGAPGTERSVVKILVPETVQVEAGVTVEELDKAVERDARRYDGGFTLL